VSRNLVIRVSDIANRIYAGTISSKNPHIMNDSKKDVTDEAIKAVFQHLMEEHKRNNKGNQSFGYGFEGLGEIHYHPPEGEKLKDVKS
jgi:hypothetical protein